MGDFSEKNFAKRHQRPLDPLREVLSLLERIRPIHEDPEQGPVSAAQKKLIRLGRRLEDRLDWGPDAPLIVAFLGATGTGKSKLFNSLVGAPISPSGFKRPTTLAPVLFAHPDTLAGLRRPLFFPDYQKREATDPVSFVTGRHRELIIVSSDDSPRPTMVLVDTPDFDSVLADNRAVAADVFDRSDAVIFITDAIKYADQSSWDYLRRLRDRGKKAVIVLNRMKNPLSLQDFSDRLNRERISRPVLSVPDEAGLGDNTPLPADMPALVELKSGAARWAGEEKAAILAGEASRDWNRFKTGLMDEFLPGLQTALEKIEALALSITRESEAAQARLIDEMAVAISGELKNSLITQIQTLFVQWDLLRYPRRLMAMPFNLIRDRILAPLGITSSKERQGLDREIDRLFETNRETLVTALFEYNQAMAERFSRNDTGRGLVEHAGFDRIPFNADTVRARYDRVRTDLENWVRDQAQELVKGLNLGEKMTFYLAQAVSLGLFISIQVHTGGGFSFFDGLLDSALAPVMSKIAGSAISRDKVKDFEREAVNRHLAGCAEAIREQERLYLDLIEQCRDGLAPALDLAPAADALRRACETLT